MTRAPGPPTPYWSTSAPCPRFPRLGASTTADVVVVGGGLTGLTTAYLLAKKGVRVVVLERHRCAGGETGRTSAHLTMVTDSPLPELVRRFGRDHAQAVWDAGLAAIAQIDAVVREHEIDAEFAWVDGYLHEPHQKSFHESRVSLEDEAALALELGFDAEYLPAVPLIDRPGIRFENQARMHPTKYLAGLAEAITALGGRIYEESDVHAFTDVPRAVTANGHAVSCDTVVLSTHQPLGGFRSSASAMAFQTKLALYTSYVVGGRVARGCAPDSLWWDTGSPYRYLRVVPQRDHDLLILGGEDHKTGQHDDTEQCYRRLEAALVAIVPEIELTHRWSGQVIETPDGLPYIGRSARYQYSATGFAGNGLTFGTLAALLIADAILDQPNPWTTLFDPDRTALTHGAWKYLKENADYPYYRIRDRFAGAETRSLRAVKRGEGAIVEHHGTKVAVSRDAAGTLRLRSAACTHMGCLVTWNQAERTWDCPCHGSRFTTDGQVISGPASAPLAEIE